VLSKLVLVNFGKINHTFNTDLILYYYIDKDIRNTSRTTPTNLQVHHLVPDLASKQGSILNRENNVP
jgi:hypothetical protein